MSPACGRRSRLRFFPMFSELCGRAAISRRKRPVAWHRSTASSGAPGSSTRWQSPPFALATRRSCSLAGRDRSSRPGPKPGSVTLREYPPSDRASSATGVGSYECDAEARVARDPGCRNRCTARRQSGQTIRSTSRLTSASSLCRRGSCGDSRVRPVSSVATAQVRKHAAPRTVFKLAAARLITEPVDGTR